MWLSWLECHPVNQMVVGSVPGQDTRLGCGFGPWWGAYGKQPIDVSLSLLPFPPL